MRADATFIGIEVDDAVAADRTIATRLAEVCPVDIYAAPSGHLELVEDRLDECVLCRLCLDAAPAGTVRVVKLYDEGAELIRA